jgi:hypothetical protein
MRCQQGPTTVADDGPRVEIEQVCDDMVWERDARYGIDSKARAQDRQVREAWHSPVRWWTICVRALCCAQVLREHVLTRVLVYVH